MADLRRVSALVQDVRDIVPVNSYGLYELVWTLNSDHPELSRDEKIADAIAAVKEVVRDDNLRLVALKWPSEVVVRELDITDITASDFDDPPKGGTYAAMMLREAADKHPDPDVT